MFMYINTLYTLYVYLIRYIYTTILCWARNYNYTNTRTHIHIHEQFYSK